MNDIEKIKDHCQSKNYNSRKYQYQIISDLTGVSPEQARQICSMQRQIRFVLPKDEVGAKKEAEWKRPNYMIEMDKEVNSFFKNLNFGGK